MKRITLIALAGIAILSALSHKAAAQAPDSTLNRTVVVEQEYAPVILDANKINAVPSIEAPVAHQKKAEYDGRILPAQNIPAGDMQIYTLAKAQAKATPGYIRLGYGNYGNLKAQADYRLKIGNKDYLGLTFRMDGTNGALDIPDGTGEWDSYYYRTHAAIDYRHDFRRLQMDIAGHFDLSNFNFLPNAVNSNQKFTAGDVHFGLSSIGDELPLQFHAETNLMVYERQHELSFANAQEVMLRTKADVRGHFSSGQFVGVAANMDNIFYRNNAFTDFTSLGLNPYYGITNDNWRIRIGVHADLAMGFGEQFRVSPDVSAAYHFERNCILYLQAKGGKVQNDFRQLEAYHPYGQTTHQLDATYEQINAALGFKLGTRSGLHLHLYGGYQNLKDDLYATWQAGFDYTVGLATWNTSNVYAGADISYDYKDIVSFTGQIVYRNWSAQNQGEELNVLAFKPAVEGKLQLDVHPISALRLHAGYHTMTRNEYNGVKAEAVNNLYLGANYEIVSRLSVYAQVNNLLNKAYQYHWGYPAEGLNFMAGASLRF